MPRLHTRVKRKLDITTSRRGKKNATPKKGARTFSTEDQAKKYAEEKKIKDYTIVPAKKGKRFKIER